MNQMFVLVAASLLYGFVTGDVSAKDSHRDSWRAPADFRKMGVFTVCRLKK